MQKYGNHIPKTKSRPHSLGRVFCTGLSGHLHLKILNKPLVQLYFLNIFTVFPRDCITAPMLDLSNLETVRSAGRMAIRKTWLAVSAGSRRAGSKSDSKRMLTPKKVKS